MRLLLDTHTLLWFLGGSSRLSANARATIEDLSNDRLFSAASAWEIAIKASLGSSASASLSRSSFRGSSTRTQSSCFRSAPST